MRYQLFISAVLAILILSVVGKAQTLTLPQAIDEGLNHSPQIQKTRAVVLEFQWKKTESLGAGFLPKVSLSGSHYFQTQYEVTNINFGSGPLSFPGFYPSTQFSLNVMVPVFDGFANVADYNGASLIEEATEKELHRSEFQLRKDIELAFYQALAAAQLEAVAQENVKNMSDHLNEVKIQHRGGAATKYDALRVEVQLNEATADAIDAKDNVVLTRQKLTELLGIKEDNRPLMGNLPVPESSKIKGLQISGDSKSRDDIQALSLRAEAARKYHQGQDLWIVPRISVGGQYFLYNQQYINNTVSDTGNYQNAYNVGVFLTWNLFDGGVSIAKANEAAQQEYEAEKTAEAAKVSVPYDLEYWKRRYLSNTDHYLSKKLDVERSEESVRLAKEEERAGTRTSTETLDAELDLFRSRAGVVNSQVSAAEALIRLELAMGKEI